MGPTTMFALQFFLAIKSLISWISYNFLLQVAQLRQRFFRSIAPGGLAGDRQGVIPASGFSFSAQQIWKAIRENRDLDLPAHRVDIMNTTC